ncbi:hypothetical protein [Aestuariivirga litoralis]|uniref:hypothetical protein n=1 Tax=Aestuariivirga litoralis TaxID=2650924 RepID=UPI0018C4EE85|nr:hypothetical protein [Aestuariivirga litoralis]MBG1232409.1 hypothetical protein [Aestuariivirga litoralis]
MTQLHTSEILKHIHDCFAEMKHTSRVADAGEILTSLRTRYPDESISIEDIGKFLFSAASIHDMGLILPGRQEQTTLKAAE